MKGRNLFLVAMVLMVGLVVLRGADPAPVENLRNGYFDLVQRAAPRSFDPQLPVRVVDIDERSLAIEGQWPWPRDRLADLVESLRDLGAAVVAFDVIFAEPDRLSPAAVLERTDGILTGAIDAEVLAMLDNDIIFADAMYWMPTVLGVAVSTDPEAGLATSMAGFAQVGISPGAFLPQISQTTAIAPPLDEAAMGLGIINVHPGASSQIVRDVPLVWRTDDGFLPGLAVETLRVAMGEPSFVMFQSPAGEGTLGSIRLGQFEPPTTAEGLFKVHFRPEHPGLYVSAADVLDPERRQAVRPLVEGQIVLVGTSAAGLLDIRTTALGQNVPGVSVHAQVLEQIITEHYLSRNDFLQGIEIGVFVLMVLGITFATIRFGPVVSVLVGGASGAAVLGASYYFFVNSGLLFDASFPLIGGFVTYFVVAVFQYIVTDRDKRLVRRSFAQYVSDGVLNEIEKADHKLELGGEIRDMTIMFVDLRNFTAMSENMVPSDLVALLNRIFAGLTDHILEQRGTIDKFIGDSIMAFWNAPVETEGHPRLASLAALGMRRAIATFNSQQPQGAPRIGLAIGLATGPACVGNIGSSARFNYSVIGDTVNVAARIENGCRHVNFDILISEDVARQAGPLATLDAGALAFKGKSFRLETRVVVGDGTVAETEEFAALAEAHEALTGAMRAGADPDTTVPLARTCAALAEEIEPLLVGFYEALPERTEDFDPALQQDAERASFVAASDPAAAPA